MLAGCDGSGRCKFYRAFIERSRLEILQKRLPVDALGIGGTATFLVRSCGSLKLKADAHGDDPPHIINYILLKFVFHDQKIIRINDAL